MRWITTPGRPLAIAAGVLAAGGALAILLQDAIRTGHWQLEHGLVPVLMAVQILTGHLAVTASRERRPLSALGFAVVAAIATWGVLYTSVGKQSTVAAEKRLAAEDVNDRRAALEKMAREAEYLLAPCPAGTPKSHAGDRCGLQKAMLDECASGKGPRCEGRAYSVQTYEAALRGYRDELEDIGPPAPVEARADKMAELIAGLSGRDPARVKHALLLTEPFTYATIFEAAALVSFGFAFGRRPERRATADRPADRPAPGDTAQTSFPDVPAATAAVFFGRSERPDDRPAGPRGPDGPRRPEGPGPTRPHAPEGSPDGRKDQVLAALLTDLAIGRTFPSQSALCAVHGVARSTMSDWLKEWEGADLIPSRRTIGRCKALQLT